jgi:hypothetical protein
MTNLHPKTERDSLLAFVRDMMAALNPVSLWQALRDADEGVCLMVPVRVSSNDRRRR